MRMCRRAKERTAAAAAACLLALVGACACRHDLTRSRHDHGLGGDEYLIEPPDAVRSLPDGRPPAPESGQPRPEAGPPDVMPLPDAKLPTSLGKKCSYQGYVTPCPDNVTYCVPGGDDSNNGFCSYKCSGWLSPCSNLPSGTYAHCSHLVGTDLYCKFLCLLLYVIPFTCPPDLNCTPGILGTSLCWP